jgi:hypothetical protein
VEPDTDSEVKRGLSDFLFDTGRALDRAAKLQRNASLSAAVRAAVVETWQHSAATAAQVQAMVDGLADGHATDREGRVEDIIRAIPGMVRHVGAGQELAQPPADQTASYLSGVQGDIQQASAASCSPAFWLGDTANANYSNLESASAPPVRAGVCEQEFFKSAYLLCVWKGVLHAADCGLLPGDILGQVDIQVGAPAVLHRNELEKAQEDQIGVLAGWKDRQTCTAERGLDWRTVQINNREFAEQSPNNGAPLALPGEETPGFKREKEEPDESQRQQ